MTKFTVHTGRKYDTQNVFQKVNQLLRSTVDRFCTGNTVGATQRRSDLIKILTEAVHILKAQEALVAKVDVKVDAKKDVTKAPDKVSNKPGVKTY
jgi:hypothetical protein